MGIFLCQNKIYPYAMELLVSFLAAAALISIQPDSVAYCDDAVSDSLSMSVDLDEVSVVARRPDVSVAADKIVFTPSSTLSGSGGSIYDALSSLPGVVIDSKGGISVNGSGGVKVMIDGRKSILTGEMLVNYLKSSVASGVYRIEVNTVPSAGHDASGGVAVINIVMKKQRDEGFAIGLNGNGRMWKAPRVFTGFMGEYVTGRHYFSLNYSFMAARNPSDLLTDRPYLSEDDRMSQVYDRRRKDMMHNVSGAYDFRFSDRLTFGASVNVNRYDRREHSSMVTDIPVVGDRVCTDNDMRIITRNIFGNANARYMVSYEGYVSANFDFFNNHNDESQLMYDDAGVSIEGKMGGTVAGYVGALDFRMPFRGDWRLTTGIKTAFVNIGNGGKYDTNSDAVAENLSSSFDYEENVNAVYAEIQKKYRGWTVNLGLRMEQTNVNTAFSGNEAVERRDYDRHDFDFFPNVSVNLAAGGCGAFNMAYARRIVRPGYADLNPFVYIFDDITHVGGNIGLKHSVSDNFMLAWAYGNRLRVSMSCGVVHDAVAKCFREITDKVVYVTPENLPRHIHSALTVSMVNLSPVSRWHLSVNGTLMYDDYRFPSATGISPNKRLTPLVDCRNMVDLGSGWEVELSGSFIGKMAYGQAVVEPVGKVYAGVRKSLLSGMASVSFFIRDMFDTNYRRSTIMLDGKSARLSEWEYEDMRLIGVSFSIRIKSGKIGKRRESDRETIDEIKRVNL